MSELMTKPRLRWACRRGMADDPDLFAWFMGHAKSKDAELQAMVQLILDRVRV